MSLNLSSLLGGGLILRQQLITANGTWTRPATMAGDTVWLTMIGGGSSGNFASSIRSAGYGGEFVIEMPVDIGTTTVVACTVGAGGAATSAAANPGGTTSFGAFLSVLGGAPGGRGAPGGSRAAASSRVDGSDTRLGFGGIVLSTSAAYAGGGGGLVLDNSGTAGGIDGSTLCTPAQGYGAGGATGSGSGSPIGAVGAPGAILVQWPEFV